MWMTFGKAARYACMRDEEFRRLLNEGHIRCSLVRTPAGRWSRRISSEDIDAFMRRRTLYARAWE